MAKSKMNLPNKLTVMRLFLVPVCIAAILIPENWLDADLGAIIALVIFAAASITDAIDGKLARKYNLITDFGKFMDPLADKMLVLAAMCWFTENGQMPGWIVAVVLFREFAVSGLRLIAVEQNRVIAAAWSGKIKTATTMVALALMMVFPVKWLNVVCSILILITTVYSGVEYFVKNRDVFQDID